MSLYPSQYCFNCGSRNTYSFGGKPSCLNCPSMGTCTNCKRENRVPEGYAYCYPCDNWKCAGREDMFDKRGKREHKLTEYDESKYIFRIYV